MKTWVQQGHLPRAHAECSACGQPIVLVADVGWVLDLPGADTYDLCEDSPFGNHAPM